MLIFASCFIRDTDFICSNFSAELGPRKRCTSRFNTHWSVRIMRRLLHSVLEAVLSLAENMAGLRFFFSKDCANAINRNRQYCTINKITNL